MAQRKYGAQTPDMTDKSISFKFLNTRLIYLIIFSLHLSEVNGQLFRMERFWKYYRSGFYIGGGITNFLGELGGRDQIGSPFIYDLELVATRPAFQIGYFYHLSQDVTIMFQGFWGILTGADSLTKEMFRHNRNIHFKTNVWEFSIMGRYKFIQEKPGHRYKLRKVRGRKAFIFGVYLQSGLAFFLFEPKAQYKGKWYKLRLLHTEGQGLKPGTKPYKPYSFAIPLTFGFTYAFDLKNRIELEVSWRKTFTDYIDDTSTEYYDPQILKSKYGEAAAYFSNPCLCQEDWAKWSTKPGQQRGDPRDKDAYITLMINYVKYIRSGGGPKAPRWFTKRKARPSF